MPGKMIQVEDYNFNAKRRRITNQSIYFNERFGRSDFEIIDDFNGKYDCLGYIMKYLEKPGEKTVFSRGLPQFFVSDILDDDVITTMGTDDSKLLLFDNFICWDEGCYVGEVSPETISQLRKIN